MPETVTIREFTRQFLKWKEKEVDITDRGNHIGTYTPVGVVPVKEKVVVEKEESVVEGGMCERCGEYPGDFKKGEEMVCLSCLR